MLLMYEINDKIKTKNLFVTFCNRGKRWDDDEDLLKTSITISLTIRTVRDIQINGNF